MFGRPRSSRFEDAAQHPRGAAESPLNLLKSSVDISVTFVAGHGEICPPHMGDPHGDEQTSPQHANPHGLGALLRKNIQEIHVDRRVVGWSRVGLELAGFALVLLGKLFGRCFGAVRAIFWLCESFLAPDQKSLESGSF